MESHARRLTYTWIALVLLACLTFALAFLPMGTFSPIVAVAIATAKAVLVILFFMELVGSQISPRLALIVALLLLGILMAIAIIDVLTRLPPALPPG